MQGLSHLRRGDIHTAFSARQHRLASRTRRAQQPDALLPGAYRSAFLRTVPWYGKFAVSASTNAQSARSSADSDPDVTSQVAADLRSPGLEKVQAPLRQRKLTALIEAQAVAIIQDLHENTAFENPEAAPSTQVDASSPAGANDDLRVVSFQQALQHLIWQSEARSTDFPKKFQMEAALCRHLNSARLSDIITAGRALNLRPVFQPRELQEVSAAIVARAALLWDHLQRESLRSHDSVFDAEPEPSSGRASVSIIHTSQSASKPLQPAEMGLSSGSYQSIDGISLDQPADHQRNLGSSRRNEIVSPIEPENTAGSDSQQDEGLAHRLTYNVPLSRLSMGWGPQNATRHQRGQGSVPRDTGAFGEGEVSDGAAHFDDDDFEDFAGWDDSAGSWYQPNKGGGIQPNQNQATQPNENERHQSYQSVPAETSAQQPNTQLQQGEAPPLQSMKQHRQQQAGDTRQRQAKEPDQQQPRQSEQQQAREPDQQQPREPDQQQPKQPVDLQATSRDSELHQFWQSELQQAREPVHQQSRKRHSQQSKLLQQEAAMQQQQPTPANSGRIAHNSHSEPETDAHPGRPSKLPPIRQLSRPKGSHAGGLSDLSALFGSDAPSIAEPPKAEGILKEYRMARYRSLPRGSEWGEKPSPRVTGEEVARLPEARPSRKREEAVAAVPAAHKSVRRRERQTDRLTDKKTDRQRPKDVTVDDWDAWKD